MKHIIKMLLTVCLLCSGSGLIAEEGQPLPDLEFYENGLRPAEHLVIDTSIVSQDISFSEEGLQVMSFLAQGGLEGKNYRHSRNMTASLGVVTTVGAIATAPTIVGPLVFLMLGGSGTLLAGANTIDEKVLARPCFNLGRLIKAAYVHLGWSNPNDKKRAKHDARIRQYINKYLDHPTDESYVSFVANSVVLANEKGWFGFMVPTQKRHHPDKEKLVFVSGSITGRKNLREVLFPNNRLSNLIHRDSSIADKVTSYHKQKASD